MPSLISKARAAERSGDLILAYDLTTRALDADPNNIDLRYLAARVLARTGATEQAAALYLRFGLNRKRKLDIVMLGARIAKDRALSTRIDRSAALRAAAAKYAQIYARTRDHYPAVNAATLYLLAGDYGHAQRYASRALDATLRGRARSSIDRYYRLASRAEAALICRNTALARTSLRNAARYVKSNLDAVATTRKQLLLVCRAIGINANILDILHLPTVLHYYGSAPLGLDRHYSPVRRGEEEFIDRIVEYVTQNNVGYAYGCLAAGGDILCAEACLRAKVDLHVVLPFDKDEFVESMVAVAGPSWVRRFEQCLRSAQSVTFATTDAYRGDNELLTYAYRLTMGMAILRARHLTATALHLKLRMGGRDRNNPAYTVARNMWDEQGHATHSLAGPDVPMRKRAGRPSMHRDRMPPRFSRALIFGDVQGFSRVPDYLRPAFQKHFLGTIAAILRRFRRHILYRNSWGDAIYIVMDDPVFAANCCLAIQEAISKLGLSRYGLPPELALRLAAHFGPVYDGQDPIRKEQTFFGGHATLAARMEPVTPPGGVYVTEAMAAVIAIANAPRLHVEYVGNTPLAKGFGAVRMYSLRPGHGAPRHLSTSPLANRLARGR